MPNIFKKFTQMAVEPYHFPDQAELILTPPARPPEEAVETEGEEPVEDQAPEEAEPDPAPKADTPIDYAQVQADMILQSARRQADEILAQARQEAEANAQAVRDAAREEGYREGYAQGAAQASQELLQQRQEQAAELGAQVQKFLEQAADSLDRQMDSQVDDLQELAMAVAEKVVCVSLKSSSEVISQMIQAAIDKRKRKEWVRIYISECDAKRMVQLPPSLTTALAALSDRVRIIPVAEDEPGTCIIEMPDEIVDASAATQLSNLRGVLADSPAVGSTVNLF